VDAKRCGVMRLIDSRFIGMAVVISTNKMISSMHVSEIIIEGKFINCSLTVIENNSYDFMRSSVCSNDSIYLLLIMYFIIDLKNN
jgi:hypothetical protein